MFTAFMETTHPDVATGKERARYIADGRISNRVPSPWRLAHGMPHSAAMLDIRGFNDAARAKRAHAEAMTQWARTRNGRMPQR